MLGTVTTAFAANCQTAATAAASALADQSEIYYHCTNMCTTYDESKNDYLSQFACVGETGSGVLSYDVSFADNNSCSFPKVTELPSD